MVFDADHNLGVGCRPNQVQVLALVVQDPHLMQLIHFVFLLDHIACLSLLAACQEQLGVQVGDLVIGSRFENIETLVESVVQ